MGSMFALGKIATLSSKINDTFIKAAELGFGEHSYFFLV
jgi:hypothetical protein